MSLYNEQQIEKAETALTEALEALPLTTDQTVKLMESLSDWVNAKIEAACDDVADRIQGRGRYDPNS